MSEEANKPDVFELALDAAGDAFQKVIDEHFSRTFDSSTEDVAGLMAEYRASSQLLRESKTLHYRSGLIDADFTCWHSEFADENFAEEASS